jgi:UDP-glucose 4-epimerase
MALYLVTGGAGFIGSHIVDALVQRGEQVRVLDNLSTGKIENIQHHLDRIEMIHGDIRDERAVQQAIRGVDFILHQAALGSISRSVAAPLQTNEVNVKGTLNLLCLAKEEKVKRFVFASSSSIYGNTAVLPKEESMRPNPLSPYAVSKLAAEGYVLAFNQVYGLPAVCLRYFNVFGPRQDAGSRYAAVIPQFISAMISDRRPLVFGDGSQSRDFTYVENVVHANLLACESEAAVGRVLNIACGARYTLNEMLQIMSAALQKSIDPVYTDERPGDVKHSEASIALARELLGYTVRITFHEGLKRTISYSLSKANWETDGKVMSYQTQPV